jgi:thioredoxin 1
MKELNEETFKELTENGTAVVDFWADWCGPCKMLAPVFEELSEELTAHSFGKVNVDDAQSLAQSHGVRAIPTIIFFKDGEEVDRVQGALPKQALKKKIEEALA